MVQLGIATHNFEFAYEHLPAGTINPTGPIRTEEKGQHVGYLVALLPYVDQSGIADNFDSAAGTYAAVNAPARQQIIDTFLCPSFPVASNVDHSSGHANYAGCYNDDEVPIDDDNNGLLFRNSKVRYSDIRDGSSNTILIGETVPTDSSLGWASGTRATLRNVSQWQGSVWWQINQMGFSEREATEVGGFGSLHQGGGNFLMASGAVVFLTETIDPIYYANLANRADGAMMGRQDQW